MNLYIEGLDKLQEKLFIPLPLQFFLELLHEVVQIKIPNNNI